MQKWEYKIIYRTRGIKAADKDGYMAAGQWDPYPNGVEGILEQLGNEGWELVAVENGSSFGSYHQMITGTGEAAIVAGVTTQQWWVFKRPKN